jgi:hypothetical protein
MCWLVAPRPLKATRQVDRSLTATFAQRRHGRVLQATCRSAMAGDTKPMAPAAGAPRCLRPRRGSGAPYAVRSAVRSGKRGNYPPTAQLCLLRPHWASVQPQVFQLVRCWLRHAISSHASVRAAVSVRVRWPFFRRVRPAVAHQLKLRESLGFTETAQILPARCVTACAWRVGSSHHWYSLRAHRFAAATFASTPPSSGRAPCSLSTGQP